MKSKSTEPEASSIIFANTVLDISEKQCRDAKFRVSTRFVDNTQLISGDVYWVALAQVFYILQRLYTGRAFVGKAV